ncbi:MAG TPA: CPBP family intramembrane glutamic endopeptidase [Candidatus Angelobacter sp.]|nr:CPBP family intramembrane glutamic endopeptidase [Candidatus Angelobacter sp.]
MQFQDPISQPDQALPIEPVSSVELVQAPAPVIEPARPPAVEPSGATVDIVDVVLVSLMAVIAFVVFGSIGVGIFMYTHHLHGPGTRAMEDAIAKNAFFVVSTQLVTYLAIVGFMAFLVWTRHRMSLSRAIQWNLPGQRLAINALMIGAALAMVSDIGEVVFHRWIPDSLPITEYFKDRPSALLLASFAILVAPLMEELLFRGFLYPALARWTGPFISVVVTASAFAMLHGAQLGYSWAPLLLIFIVGVTLTVTRVVTRSVATGVIVHMTYNFALLLQTYIVTHGFRQMQGS